MAGVNGNGSTLLNSNWYITLSYSRWSHSESCTLN